MKLYDYILSPSCYKVRLMAALAGVTLDLHPVDFHPGVEHRSPKMLAINPAGTIPILEHDDLLLTESSAMLAYISATASPEWLGDGSPAQTARIQQWLSFSGRLTSSLGGARLDRMLLVPGDIDALQKAGTAALRELEAGLAEQAIRGQRYLAADRPTIADIACFPYVALAPDGNVSLDPYPTIRLWSRSLRSLPNFIEMPGIHRLHELKPEPEIQAESA
ncbi:glutathione S-transferase family protein [Agrobacterium larrymoorei]|uniref:glutathione S-transferase family protein n=1 Tax=Agrobacterium larrymoorei TaxID=160699 RepID=UPI0015732A55|nr:glutathione S-transferase family protein [Agrobacterium larrymoorei]NTJ43707.1 glutathione S-transferase family protein [Agrobacterium larrymoorei]